jgi:hypothetical protein
MPLEPQRDAFRSKIMYGEAEATLHALALDLFVAHRD